MMEPEKSPRIAQAIDSRKLLDSLREISAARVAVIDEKHQILAANYRASISFPNWTWDVLPSSLRDLVLETFRRREGLPEHELELGVGSQLSGSKVIAETLYFEPASFGKLAVLLWSNAADTSRVEQNIRRLERLASMGTFSAGMAHEIKNALVAIKTFVQRAREREEPEFTETAIREIRRIDSIVGQMLRFAGPAKPVFSPLGVHRLVEQALRSVHSQLESKSIQVARSFAADSDQVRGDEFQLEQALVNLFLNAVAAMPPGGRLTIGTRLLPPSETEQPIALREAANAAQLEIFINDTGEGITPANMGRLFEPFFTTKPEGTGLGLSITRRIIQEHGGEIRVESQLNEGTTFTLLLPLGRGG